MAITGYQRSLTVDIDKTIADVQADGYPHTYYGRNAFTQNGTTYDAITVQRMITMPQTVFDARLAAFMAYIEAIESGLEFDTDTVDGFEARRQNLVACPIP